MNWLFNHSEMQRFAKTIPAGDYVFRQGQVGNTMFIIAHGTIALIAEREGEEHTEGLLGTGQFLGEKAIMKTGGHRRVFSAQASTETVVFELGLEDMDGLQKSAPDVMINILKQMFLVASQRLDRSNYLARILRSSDNSERLVNCILYFCRTSGVKVSGGLEVLLTRDSIFYHIDMTHAQIEKALQVLTDAGITIPLHEPDRYFIKSEGDLLNYIPKLKAIMSGTETKAA